MPRANRYYLPGHVWHITHRCHNQAFLLKFKRDRRLWRRWLFEARRRFGLRVLDYIATSNHVHLLVRDRGDGEIGDAMQLIAGRTAHSFNGRRHRRGAFWEDRYQATAVESGEHLRRCLVYIDLNMVRAGQVRHPGDWDTCGYQEIQSPRARYRIVDTGALMDVLGIQDPGTLKEAHREWIEEALNNAGSGREGAWTEGLAVGSRPFVEHFQTAQGALARQRRIEAANAGYCLREEPLSYNVRFDPKKGPLSV